MEVDRDTLPRWGWLILGLFAASVAATMLNVAALFPLGLPEEYGVVTTVALMAPVLIYVGVWYDEERRSYWEHSRERIVGDAAFVVIGAALGTATMLVAIREAGFTGFVADIVGMLGGFVFAWGLFWWRNAELYRDVYGGER